MITQKSGDVCCCAKKKSIVDDDDDDERPRKRRIIRIRKEQLMGSVQPLATVEEAAK